MAAISSNTQSANQNIDIAALQQTIIQNIKHDINQHINTQIQQEMAPLQHELMTIKRDFNSKQDSLDHKITQMQTDLASILVFMSSLKNGGGMH